MPITISYPDLFRSLYRIRRVEEEVARVYPTDKIKSPVHLSIGQEATSVAVCHALRPTDIVFGTYRGHALYMAKGGNLHTMIAELYGKDSGCTRGKGGSMHLIAPDAGLMGTSAVVGTTVPHAVGYSYAMRLMRRNDIVAAFFGDGGFEEGVIAESLNFAALKRLPVLFVCENNFYAIHTPIAQRQPRENICERVAAYNIETALVDDGDVLRTYDIASRAIDLMRESGKGPFFLETRAYRWREHVGPNEDFHAGYRTRKEAAPWKARDPVEVVGRLLADDERRRIQDDVEKEISAAFKFAEEAPAPHPDELYTDLYNDS